MANANELITGALEAISTLTPGEPVDGSEAARALAVLNRMLKGWKNLMVPFRTLEGFSISSGVGARTIGPGAQLNTVKPDKITDAYLRDANGFDHPINVFMTSGEHNAISLKTVTGRPTHLFFDSQHPNGVIYFDRVTDATYTLFLESLKPVNQFTTLQTEIALPDEYEEPIVYLLAHRLAPGYGVPISEELAVLIRQAEKNIKRGNVKAVRATFDGFLSGPPIYDINQG